MKMLASNHRILRHHFGFHKSLRRKNVAVHSCRAVKEPLGLRYDQHVPAGLLVVRCYSCISLTRGLLLQPAAGPCHCAHSNMPAGHQQRAPASNSISDGEASVAAADQSIGCPPPASRLRACSNGINCHNFALCLTASCSKP